MSKPYYDPKIFLLEHDFDKELIQQTLEILEFVCGDSDMSVDQDKNIKQMFTDVVDKYKDIQTISIEAVKERISEQGYSYLIDVFEASDENLRVLASYLPMIQIMKGTESGLRLIFTILNVGFEVKEWWQDPTNLEILSYILFVELINQPITTTVVPRLKEFSRQYVYPLLTQVLYAVTYKLNKTPYIGAVAYTKTELAVWQEIMWLIWSSDGDPDQRWTDQKPFQDPETHKSLWQGSEEKELEWDPHNGSDEEINKWSSTDNSSVRTWKYSKPEDLTDTDLLEWWIERLNSTKGRPEESWCTEDPRDEDPIITFWSGGDGTEDTTLVKLLITANPSNALIEINGELMNHITVIKGTEVSYRVYDLNGSYVPESNTIVLTEDTSLTVSLMRVTTYFTLTIVPNVDTARVVISETENPDVSTGTIGSASYKAKSGTKLYWVAYAENYKVASGSEIIPDFSDLTKEVILEKLPEYTLNINPTPSDATVIINEEERKSITVYENTEVNWSVSKFGYISKSGMLNVVEDKVIDVVLAEVPKYTFAISPTPSDATVIINGEERKSIVVYEGTQVEYSVSKNFYKTNTGAATVVKDTTLSIVLDSVEMYTITLEASPSSASISFSVVSGSVSSITANSVTGLPGTVVKYTVDPNSSYYKSTSGEFTIDSTRTITVSCPSAGTSPSGSKSVTNSFTVATSASLSATVQCDGVGPCRVYVSGSASSTSYSQKLYSFGLALYTSSGTLTYSKDYSDGSMNVSGSTTFDVESGVRITKAVCATSTRPSSSGHNKFSITTSVSVS